MKIDNLIKSKRLLYTMLALVTISLISIFIESFGIDSINPFYYFLQTPYDIEQNVQKRIARKFEYIKIYPYPGAYFANTKFVGNNQSYYITVSYHLDSLDDCRLFFAEIITKYLKEYNSERKIRPYFRNYPLSPKDIYFTFIVEEPATGKRKVTMQCIKGRISFYLYDVEGNRENKETIDTSENIFELYSEYKKNNPNEDILKKYKFL